MGFSKKIYFLLIGLVLSSVMWVYAGQPQYVPPPDPFPDIPFPLDPPDPITDPFDPMNDFPLPPLIPDFPPEDPLDDPFNDDLPIPDPPHIDDPFDFPSLFPGDELDDFPPPPIIPPPGTRPAPAAAATNTFVKLMPFPMRLPFHPAYSGQSAPPTGRNCSANTASQLLVAESKGNTVAYVSTCPGQITARVPVGMQPVAIAHTPDGTQALVANSGDGTVSVINIAAKAVIRTIPLIAPDGSTVQPNGIAILPDGSRAYVTDHACNTNPEAYMFIIDLSSFTVTSAMPVGCFPASVKVTPDGSQVWVSSRGDGRVDVYDTATNAPVTAFGIQQATGIAFNPTGTRAYLAAGSTPGFIVVVDMSSYQKIAAIPVGDLPHRVAVTPTGRHVFVTNLGSNSISQINTDSNTVVRTIPLKNGAMHPLGLAFVR
jgi:YVTN family beta-propeller protein